MMHESHAPAPRCLRPRGFARARSGVPIPTGALAAAAALACSTLALAQKAAEPSAVPPHAQSAPAATAQAGGPTAPPAPTPPADPLLFKEGPWTIKVGIFAGTQVAVESNGFWGLSDVFAPSANYSRDRLWDESWFVPSVRVTYTASESLDFYAGLGIAATGNLGRDVFEQGNSGRVSLENAFGGVRLADAASDFSLDLSGGQQPYRYGTGMLIDLGAQNGNQRGAALVSPRRAWEYTGVARLTFGQFAADVFLLNYNEIGSNDPDTTLAGGKIEYRFEKSRADSFVGVGYVNAFDSTMPYIRAPLTIINDGRDGTETINPYLRIRPAGEALPGLYAALEGAYQWNDSIDLSAYAISAEVGHQWEGVALRPKLSYAFRLFSGDDPKTATLERFDPLFYDGSVHAFASGSNAALAFYNTNVQTHRLELSLTLSEADFLTLSYWRVDAAEIDSPLQFGQAGRLQFIDGKPALVSGVPSQHLSDDFYVEYVRALTANAYLTLGVGVSFPGDGLEGAAGRNLDPWAGGLVNLSFSF